MTARVDLRSDTVTRPTDAMRRAMAAADVGDDTFGDDPTVNRLEHMAAELTGKQAAVYLAAAGLVALEEGPKHLATDPSRMEARRRGVAGRNLAPHAFGLGA